MENNNVKFKITKDIVVLYHGNCTDGFGAAWAAWKKFGDEADYVGVKLDTPPEDDLINKEIFMLDFVYHEQYLKNFVEKNKKVVAIDHHVTNKKILEITSFHLYDINHSGAFLSWKYFHPESEIPKIIEHVEDSDLGRFSLPFTRELWSYINLFDFDFNIWSKLASDFEDSAKCDEYIKIGKLLLKFRNKIVKESMSLYARLVNFEGLKVYALNSRVFHSEVGSSLAEKFPPMAIVWAEENDGRIHISLRSDGTVDVSEIAAKYGGGGHKKAAGFYVSDFSKLPWKKIGS